MTTRLQAFMNWTNSYDVADDNTINVVGSTYSDPSGENNNIWCRFPTSNISRTFYGNDGQDDIGGDFVAGDFLYGGSGNDWLEGNGGLDQLFGESGHDLLVAYFGSSTNDTTGPGDEWLQGGTGNDTLMGHAYGSTAQSRVIADYRDVSAPGYIFVDLSTAYGANYDQVVTAVIFRSGITLPETDTLSNIYDIVGSQGNDQITGHARTTLLTGEGGNDILNASASTLEVTMWGGAGEDTITGSNQRDTIYGEDSNDTINGGGGNDILHGNQGMDTVRGGAGDDEVSGESEDDNLYGDDGNDTLIGGLGHDYLYGGNNNDKLYGSEDIDRLFGEDGDDELYGEQHKDVLQGGKGNDILNGGDDIDTAYFTDHFGNITGGWIFDMAAGTARSDYLWYVNGVPYGVLPEIDTLVDIENVYGSAGNDIYYATKDNGNFFGEGGTDTLVLLQNFFDDAPGYPDYVVTMSPGVATGTFSLYDANGDLQTYTNTTRFDSVERLVTGSGNDTVTGSNFNERIETGNGNDVVYGQGGADKLYGGAGADKLDGGGGNDMLYGGAGADTLIGGLMLDYACYDDAAYGDIRVSLAANAALGTNAAAGDTFTSIEGIISGSGNDWIYGDNANNWLYGGGGNDNLHGSNGADYIDGGAGLDYVRFDDASYQAVTADLANTVAKTGSAAGDTYVNVEGLILTGYGDIGYGDGNANYLYGLGGGDTLDGRGGDDNLSGGVGNDTLTGGLGNDTFTMRLGYGRDTITDFAGGSGVGDKLDLRFCGFTSFSQVLAASVQVGANLEVRVNANDVFVVNNFLKGNFAADDVMVV